MKFALFVFGGLEGHQPKETTHVLAGELEAKGFSVTLSETLDDLEDTEALLAYDLIVPNWTMGELSGPQVKNLQTAIAQGCGLGGWHGGMGDAFRENCNFQFMTGGQFVAHPGGIIKYTVNIVDQDHPTTTGLSDFEMESEQYYMHTDPANEVLATTNVIGAGAPWLKGVVMPVVWTRRHGEGRVFYCSLGHVAKDFDVPECREIISRGLVWAAR